MCQYRALYLNMKSSDKNLIIADEGILDVTEQFADLGEVVCLPTADLTAEAIKNAQILLVRSATPVDKVLLQSADVRFVGTASAGFDNLDTDWLEQHNIRWAYAPGCNAHAVADYVLCCLASFIKQGLLKKPVGQLRVGVIGVGHIGREVAQRLQAFNCRVLLNDPPCAQRDPSFHSTPLKDFHHLDLICIHAALTQTGAYPSANLIEQTFLTEQRPGTIILNCARGEIINTPALKQFGQHCHWCFDVWDREPDIDLAVLKKTVIATPHIAGYNKPAKLRATKILRQTFDSHSAQQASPSRPNKLSAENLLTQARQLYDPHATTEMMKCELLKRNIDVGTTFTRLRKAYPLRDEL